PYEQAVRDSRINLIFEGTNEILRALVALMGLQEPGERLKEIGEAFKRPIQSLGAIGSYLAGRAKRQVKAPTFTRVHPALRQEAELVQELVQDMGLAVEGVLMKHGKKVIERQFLQERLANATIDIYMATAVLSRTTWELQRAGGPEEAAYELDCARVFVPMAYRRARRNLRGLRRNQDERLRQIAARVIERADLGPVAPIDRE
ncbi:MAG TPA: hypothetical protein VEA99_16900, partial [Gemmatimonadaceae bacterium]|nr:hypothetical protein [Gemmatimonadaceae bacterium]